MCDAVCLSHSEQDEAEGVCGGPVDVSGTPEMVDRLSQGTSSMLSLPRAGTPPHFDAFADASAPLRSVLRRHRRLLATDGSAPTGAAASSSSRRT